VNLKFNKKILIGIYTWVVSLAGAAVCAYSIYHFPLKELNILFYVVAIVTIFFSSRLQIQLPRTKIHVSISEVLIFFTLLFYGSAAAVLLATLESLYTSIQLRFRGTNIKNSTIAINGSVGALSTFVTALVLNAIFVSPEIMKAEPSISHYAAMIMVMALTQFTISSIGVSVITALKSDQTFWQVWSGYCINALIIYIAAALIAGVAVKANSQVNSFLLLLVVCVSGVVYFTYRRYINDIKETAAKAELAERERTEQAEKHIEELKHHISEQDRISTALRDSKERFRHAAFHDALTDLPNRNLFIETIKFLLEKSKVSKRHNFAILFLDLNRFKTINESLGHSIGDKLILHVAQRLSNLVRGEDMVARFSGDEFAIILNKVSDIEDAKAFADLIRQRIAEPFTLSGRRVFTGVSIGIAMSSSTYEEAEDILRDADIAMYYAKDKQKDIVVFDKTMHARAVTLLQLETDLRYAIDRDELCAYYQPIVDIDTLGLIGFEALIRWNHPRRGLVPPVEFIPVSEQTGLIVPITLWMLRHTCRQMVEWQSQSSENDFLILSVNLSGKHFAYSNLVDQVREIIEETGINPACLKLEITESAVMENAETVILMLKELKELGVQLSIDDFGTGYSSLSYLHRFPIDTLKVDRSFVSTMEDGSENGEIVRTIVSLAKTLGMNVVAEGIETIHQLHQLRVLGCEYGQGYLFSRPVPNIEAELLLKDKMQWRHILPRQRVIPPVVQKSDISHLRLTK
jgi:diguanylate cyclase (GGDEF)-like protein